MSTKPRNQDADGDNCLSKYEYVFKEDLLKGQVAFVTGGGSGIGFRIAEILMRHGCNLAIASRKLERVQTAAKELERATGGRCIALKADIRNPKEIENAVDEILRHYGKINILVNNAAGNFLCDAESLSYNAFKTVLEIDTMGTFNVSKAVFQKYFKDHGGSIVNITATLHYKGDVMQVHAGSAKAAIDAMTKHLAVEWGGNGVRINCIAPGPINGTEGFKRLGGNSSVADAFVESIPVQRWGRKYEIADTVVYLASNASSYVTGAVLIVDGGTWLTSFNNFSLVKNMVSTSKL